jgi:hypothetical protein
LYSDPAGHLLGAKGRNEKAMDDILRGHDELDGPADRNMQLVDLALSFGMLKLPHPLFRDDVHGDGIVRRPRLRERLCPPSPPEQF